MKSKLYILPLLAASFAAGFMLCGCSGKKEKVSEKNLPTEVRPVADAILDDNPESFASAMDYPVSRPYPLHDIEDSVEMVNYYPTLVDDSLKRTVRDTPDSLWQQEGWRGWTIRNGSYFWIDSGRVYQVNYISDREREMIDSLRRREIASLDPSLREGWNPVACVVDTVGGAIFRIDANDSIEPPTYRLSGYSVNADLSGVPTVVLYGSLDEEGSMENRFYHFRDDEGDEAEYSPDVTDDSDVPVIHLVRKGKEKRYPVKRSYWLDHIHRSRELRNTSAAAEIDSVSLSLPPAK